MNIVKQKITKAVLAILFSLVCCPASATIPGPGLILTCPHCKAQKIVFSTLSGNTFGARLWSDMKLDAPMGSKTSFVQHCPRCHKYYTLSSQKGEPRYSKNSFGETFGHLSYEEWKEAIRQFTKDNSFGDKKDESSIRLLFIQAYNDYHFRGDTIRQPSAFDRRLFTENAEAFLKSDDLIVTFDLKIFKAEMFRECGRFEECKEYAYSLRYTVQDFEWDYLLAMMRKADEKDCQVFLFE